MFYISGQFEILVTGSGGERNNLAQLPAESLPEDEMFVIQEREEVVGIACKPFTLSIAESESAFIINLFLVLCLMSSVQR